MKKFAKKFATIVKDDSGQGMLEYVVILTLVIAVGLIFKSKITSFFSQGTDAVTSQGQSIFSTSSGN